MVGVGNRSGGDDGVGPYVAERVRLARPPGSARCVVRERAARPGRDPRRHDVVVVIDAVSAQGDPGQVHVWQVDSLPPARATRALGSHGLGLREAIELARTLDCLPSSLTVVGVEGVTFEFGAQVSQPVREHVPEAVQAVRSAGLGARTATPERPSAASRTAWISRPEP